MDEAEPAPDLFLQIEARLDRPSLRRDGRRRWIGIAIFLLGLAVGVLCTHGALDRQEIVAQPSAQSDWVPLGSVTLHGPGLRGFVRAKCRGHTHFLITMHGHDPGATDAESVPLMGAEEKILMECIF